MKARAWGRTSAEVAGGGPASPRWMAPDDWVGPAFALRPDQQVGAGLGEVTDVVRPTSSLFAPQVLSRALVAAMWRTC